MSSSENTGFDIGRGRFFDASADRGAPGVVEVESPEQRVKKLVSTDEYKDWSRLRSYIKIINGEPKVADGMDPVVAQQFVRGLVDEDNQHHVIEILKTAEIPVEVEKAAEIFRQLEKRKYSKGG